MQLPEQFTSDADVKASEQAFDHELMAGLQVSTKTVQGEPFLKSLEHLEAKAVKLESRIAAEIPRVPPVSSQFQEGDRDHPHTMSHAFFAAFDTLRLLAFFILLAVVYALAYPQQGSKTAQLDASSLSGFRLVLAVWVFLEHAGVHKMNGGTSFIVLSSCVISQARRKDFGVVNTSLLSIDALSKFYAWRFVRLLPLYYCYLAYIRACEHTASQGILVFTIQALREFMMLPVQQWKEMLLIRLPDDILYSHLWLVQTMVVMYMLYPLLERLALGPATSQQPSSQRRVCFVIVACVALKISVCAWMLGILWSNGFSENSALSAWYTWRGTSLFSMPLLRIPEFVLGIMIFHVSLGSSWRGTWLCTVSDAFFVISILAAFAYRGFPVGYMLTDMNVQSPLVALIIWAMCFGPVQSRFGKVLSSELLVTLSECSFGVYIYHLTILRKMGLLNYRNLDNSWSMTCWQALPIALAISFIFSWVTFRLVELPSQRLAHWLLQEENSTCQPASENSSPTDTLDSLASLPCKQKWSNDHFIVQNRPFLK